jgi:hypothetical protein
MEPQQYNNLLTFLNTQQFPANFNQKQKLQLKKAAKYFENQNGILYHQDEINNNNYQRVIKQNELETILYNTHDSPLAGHLKLEATLSRLQHKYFWYNMKQIVQKYISNCEVCQREGRRQRNEPLRTIKVNQPFGRVGIDIVGPLPRTKKGKKYIVVAMDYLTKWPEARAIPDATAASVASFFYEDIICRHGCPQEIISDNGSAFISQMVESMLENHQIKHRLISPYHPQSNGLVERFNRTLCKSLAKFVQLQEQDWDKFIPSVLFAYRTMKHNTTKYDPFSLVYGRNVITPLDLLLDQKAETLTEEDLEQDILNRICQIVDILEPTLELAKRNIAKSQRNQEDANPASSTAHHFEEGDIVLKFKHDKPKGSKFQTKWVGPYTIHEVYNNGAYRLRSMDGKVLKSSTNGNDLRKYNIRDLPEPTVVIE